MSLTFWHSADIQPTVSSRIFKSSDVLKKQVWFAHKPKWPWSPSLPVCKKRMCWRPFAFEKCRRANHYFLLFMTFFSAVVIIVILATRLRSLYFCSKSPEQCGYSGLGLDFKLGLNFSSVSCSKSKMKLILWNLE